MTENDPQNAELENAKKKHQSLAADYSAIRKENARLTKRAQGLESTLATANARVAALNTKLAATRDRSIMLEARARETAAALNDAAKKAAISDEARANAVRYFEQLSDLRGRLQTRTEALRATERRIDRLEHTINREVERTVAATEKMTPVRERNLTLEERLKTLSLRLKSASAKVDLLETDNDRLRAAVSALEVSEDDAQAIIGEPVTASLAAIDKANEVAEARREAVFSLRNRLDVQNERVRQLHTLTPINWLFNYGKAVLETMPEDVDCLLTHGLQPLAIMPFAEPGRFQKTINDCIEIPSLLQRAVGGNSDPVVRDWISRALGSHLPESDTVFTVSAGLTAHLQSTGCENVVTLPNFRRHSPVPTPNDLRERLNIPPGAFVILSAGRATSGWEEALRGFAQSGDDLHLVNLGPFSPVSYGDEVRALVQTLGLSDRVHLCDPVPYAELSACCASADIGVIIRDPEIGNHAISLPNRVFDYLAGGLPFLAADMPDIANIINQFRCGEVLTDVSASGWANGVAAAREEQAAWRQNATVANDTMTWEAHLPVLESAFEGVNHVAIAGIGDLTKNNRTYRIAEDLIGLGKAVSIFTIRESERARFLNLGATVTTA